MTIGEKLRACRFFTDEMSQRQLARLVGISQPALSNIEQGISNPDQETLRAMEKVFGIPLADQVTIQDFFSQLVAKKEEQQPIAA